MTNLLSKVASDEEEAWRRYPDSPDLWKGSHAGERAAYIKGRRDERANFYEALWNMVAMARPFMSDPPQMLALQRAEAVLARARGERPSGREDERAVLAAELTKIGKAAQRYLDSDYFGDVEYEAMGTAQAALRLIVELTDALSRASATPEERP